MVRAAISSQTARCRVASIGAAQIPCRRTTAPANSCSSSTACIATRGDMELLRELWPAAVKAVAYMDKLRLSERTAANQQGDRQAFYGKISIFAMKPAKLGGCSFCF